MRKHKHIVYVESVYKTIAPFVVVVILGGFVITMLGMFAKHCIFMSYIVLLFICGIVCTLFIWISEMSIRMRYYYTQKIWQSMLICVVLFIFSEILVFLGIFWTYFDRTYNKWNIQMSMPDIYEYIDITESPLIGTILLIFSGICMNITIYRYIYCYQQEIYVFVCGWFAGLLFFLLQIFEYTEIVLSINIDVYSSLFYLITGLHGLHVVIGLLLLLGGGPIDVLVYYRILCSAHESIYRLFVYVIKLFNIKNKHAKK